MSYQYYGFTHAGTQYGTEYTPSEGGNGHQQQSAHGYGHNAGSHGSRNHQQAAYSFTDFTPPNVSGNLTYATIESNSQSLVPNSGYNDHQQPNVGSNPYDHVVNSYASAAIHSGITTIRGQAENAQALAARRDAFRQSLRGGRPKPRVPKPPQLHYCEICKVSCAGPLAYGDHLKGQKHKKKEATQREGLPSGPKMVHGQPVSHTLRCELCEINCVGPDAYAAHLRGTKHDRVVRLHKAMGKEIPDCSAPTVVDPKGKVIPNKVVKLPEPPVTSSIKVVGTPRINFSSGGRLHTTPSGTVIEKPPSPDTDPNAPLKPINFVPASKEAVPESSEPDESSGQDITTADGTVTGLFPDPQPIGHEFIEEVKIQGRPLTIKCNLCDCEFTDKGAKDIHMKGRRHRLNYKQKVDPNYVVEEKVYNTRNGNKKNDVRRGQPFSGDPFKVDQISNRQPHSYMPTNNFPRYEASFPEPFSPFPPPMPRSHIQSLSDSYLLEKHTSICPKEDELDEIHHAVQCVERALKMISDKFASEEEALQMNAIIEKELGQEVDMNAVSSSRGVDDKKLVLKGSMRVGCLAKGLILTGDKDVEIVLLSVEKPTRHLLQRVAEGLPQELKAISAAETFEITMKPQEGSILVKTGGDSRVNVIIHVTSPAVAMAEEPEMDSSRQEMVKDGKQLLDAEKCLRALALIRHAKWFQHKVTNLYPCPMMIRILKNLRGRDSSWAKLPLWTAELLCESVISSANEHLTPAEAFRHILEALSSGIILPCGAGLLDPCEKSLADVTAALSAQDRLDITRVAQHSLRQAAFGDMHKLLDMEEMTRKKRTLPNDVNMEDESKKLKSEDSPMAVQ